MSMKKLVGILIIMVFILSMGINAFAATVGQPLASPESGWSRYDDRDIRLSYYQGNWGLFTEPQNFNSTRMLASDGAEKIRFKFYGTQFRIIGTTRNTNRVDMVTVIVDDVSVGTYSQLLGSATGAWQILLFEKTGLSLSEHTVQIQSSSLGIMDIDAIDIDDTGYLVEILDSPTNLIAATSDTKIDLSWTAISGSDITYNVKRSTTAGGPYTTITTTSAITYEDNTVTNGTTYYYVVSAVNSSGESDNSNEVSATPTTPEEPPIIGGNKAILQITLTNGAEKEYDLTAVELQDFLTWYDDISGGTGKAYYTFALKNNIKPFLSRKEYIAFDKIFSFEVKDYNE